MRFPTLVRSPDDAASGASPVAPIAQPAPAADAGPTIQPASDLTTAVTVAAAIAEAAPAGPIAAALAGFEGWWAAHVVDSPISRDTAAYNSIFDAAHTVRSVLGNIKE